MKKILSVFAFLALMSPLARAEDIPQTIQLPPNLSTAGTTAIVDGQTWAYLVWNSNIDGWLVGKKLSIHTKTEGAANFTLQGHTQLITDPSAIAPWINRASLLGENISESTSIATMLFNQWKNETEVAPNQLNQLLSTLTNRVAQDPPQNSALQQIGQSRPLFRFISGSGWAGPLNVPQGTEVTIEVRDESAKVVGRVILNAGNPVQLEKPGPPVQVPPPFPTALPIPAETYFPVKGPSTQIDRSISLRWAIPESLRKQILLTSGFHVWKLPSGYAGPLNANALETNPTITRITGSPATASKIFRIPGSGESGPDVNDFTSDLTTWFVVDDNDRYATDPSNPKIVTGIPYNEGDNFEYAVAAVDLLGRFGPVSDLGPGTAAYQVPPQVPDVLRAENIMDGQTQRLRVVWKPNENRPSDVPTTHYLVYRDRTANAVMQGDELKKSTYRGGSDTPDYNTRDGLIYLGAVAHQDDAQTLSFTDTTLTPQAHDYSNPYFYCIRAAHLGPFGYDISRPSPAVFGTIRDRAGPGTPTGHLRPDCPRVGIRSLKLEPRPIGSKPLGPNKATMRFNVWRGLEDGTYNDISWVLVGATTGSGSALAPGEQPSGNLVAISPALFFGRENFLSFDLVVPTTGLNFSILAVSSSGTISHVCTQESPNLTPGVIMEADFRTIAGPILTMEPEPVASQRNLYWQKFFSAPEVFTPRISGPDTACGTTVTVSSTTSRYLLIQNSTDNRNWTNRYAARVLSGQNQFYFPFDSSDESRWRYWVINESPFTPDPGLCPHESRNPGDSSVNPVGVVLNIPIDANEYRLYRRINEGSLTLLDQAADEWDDSTVQTIVYEDNMIPPAGGQIAYYGQVFDEHGNPSPLKLLETRVNALAELPTPVLEEIKPSGTEAAPTMLLKAVAPSPGVARLEFVISPPLPSLPDGLVLSPKLPSQMAAFNPGEADGPPQSFSATYAGPNDLDRPPSQPAILEIEVPIEPDTEYTVTAHCVGLAEKTGNNRSSNRKFTWFLPPPLNEVPWPTRSAPNVIPWDLRIKAYEFTQANATLSNLPHTRSTSTPPALYPVAIRIGQIPITNLQPNYGNETSNWRSWGNIFVTGDSTIGIGRFGINNAVGMNNTPAPNDLFQQFLFKQKFPHPELVIENSDSSLFPFVVYRKQIARRIEGIDEKTPGTDIIQASHLVRSIIWDNRQQQRPPNEEIPPPTGYAFLSDPWIGVARFPSVSEVISGGGALVNHIDLCYFDTTPVTEGATYQYYLLHFNEVGEPDGIIDAGTVTISD